MSATTDAKLKVARPSIAIDGQDNATLAGELLRLQVAEDTAGLYHCEATFGNWGAKDNGIGFLYFDRRTLDFGKTLRIVLGAASGGAAIFEGRITALEGRFPQGRSAELTILAEDRFQDLRMTRRTRTFEDVADADVMTQLANEHGLAPQIDLTGPKHAVLAQLNQSDLAFLRERARACDAELWLEGKTLRACPRARRRGGPVRLTYGEELGEFTVLADLAQQRTSLAVSGWDPARKAGLRQVADDALVSGELDGGVSGASVLSAAFGKREEALVHAAPRTGEEAQAEAEALFKVIARRFLVGHGVADADARLRVGATVDLRGLGPLFNGRYYLSAVRHSFDGATGMSTEFTAERAGLGRPQ